MNCSWAIAVLMLATYSAAAAEPKSAPPPPPAAPAPDTLKERLSDKASDRQRVDNCKVAPERRGPEKRPDTCGDAAAAGQHGR